MSQLVAMFCDIDDFCKVFEPIYTQRLLQSGQCQRQRQGQLSLSEIMTIIVYFHSSHYRDFKHYYTESVVTQLRPYFPALVSYSRFVELLPRALQQALWGQGLALITLMRRNMKPRLLRLWDWVMLRKRFLIETINDQLKNISQIEHSRHRSLPGFMVNLVGGLIAYTFQPKKPSLGLWCGESGLPVVV